MNCFAAWQVTFARDWWRRTSVQRWSFQWDSAFPWRCCDCWTCPRCQQDGQDNEVSDIEVDDSEFKLYRSDRSALAAVAAVAALNVPAIVYFRAKHANAAAIVGQSIHGKTAYVASFVSSSAAHFFIKNGTERIWASSIKHIWNNVVITPSLRWWTFISSNFVHTDVAHFKRNLGGLLWFGLLCTRVESMNAIHIAGLTLSACVGASLGTMMYVRRFVEPWSSWSSMGASGIVYAFAAVSALGCPSEYVQTPLGKIPVFWILEYFPWMMIFSECESLQRGGKTFKGQRISHYGHLGGAIAGAVYYFTMLHWRQKRKRQRRGFNPLLSHYLR